ncbi:hypothetical protein EVAR_33065_1 [Eumeta japonica]|uniref:Uncharacterized protein n=1 Tax=Eumeta variegata TaxID=151549 RepID=A0A4C1WSX7_EUMVA|nr:hypothetical protein EVAR_33065_1 [Eumeta japonica]
MSNCDITLTISERVSSGAFSPRVFVALAQRARIDTACPSINLCIKLNGTIAPVADKAATLMKQRRSASGGPAGAAADISIYY